MPDTIEDFGRQWTHFTENRGFYGSTESLDSLFAPLLDPGELRGLAVADVGAGTGRYTRMFHELGAARILALEPSAAVEVLSRNTRLLERVEVLRATAEGIPPQGFDLVFCIGVLQFIPDPIPALQAMGRALAPDGRLFVWVYGRENAGIYLAFARALRTITRRLPHRALDPVASALLVPASLYAACARRWRLPLSDYVRGYFSRLDRYSRKAVIYDQLNPTFARYYRREELEDELHRAGFIGIRLQRRLGYSWSALARPGPDLLAPRIGGRGSA